MAEPERTTEDGTDKNLQSPDGPPSCSSLTTKELQQNWRAVKKRERPARLLFEVPSTRLVQRHRSTYVVYQVVVMLSGSFDARRVSVERRFRDFCRLHLLLQEELWEELEEVALPRRLLTGTSRPAALSERRLGLQAYLSRLHAARGARHSPHFSAFFTEREQRRALGLLRAGRPGPAAEQLQEVLELQEKLLPWQSPALSVPTLAALAVCYRDLEEPGRAFAAAQRALPPARRHGPPRYRASLLDLLLDLGRRLGRPVAPLQQELALLRDAEGGGASRSLKELVVQQFT